MKIDRNKLLNMSIDVNSFYSKHLNYFYSKASKIRTIYIKKLNAY